MGDEVPRPRRVAPVLGPLRVAAQARPALLQGTERLDVAGKRTLHIRDAETVEPPVALERVRLEARDVAQPGLPSRVRGVHVAVEHQRLPAARPGPGPEDVGTRVLDLLPLHLQA